VLDRLGGKSAFVPTGKGNAKRDQAAVNRLAEAVRLIRRAVFLHGRVGVVTFEAVEAAIAKALAAAGVKVAQVAKLKEMPQAEAAAVLAAAEVVLGHFNAVRGSNAFVGVRCGIRIGTLTPGTGDVEDTAEILTGRPVRRLERDGWYELDPVPLRTRHGGAVTAWASFHPDAAARLVLQAIQDEMIQADARWRPLDADSRGGLHEIILGMPGTEVPLDGVVPFAALLAGSDLDEALAVGVVPESLDDFAAVVGEGGDARDRIRQRLTREGISLRAFFIAAEEDAAGAKSATSAYKDLYKHLSHSLGLLPSPPLGSCVPDWLERRFQVAVFGLVPLRYQRQNGRSSRVLVDMRRHPDPIAAVRAVLGCAAVLLKRKPKPAAATRPEPNLEPELDRQHASDLAADSFADAPESG
jgi:hypothetical protein